MVYRYWYLSVREQGAIVKVYNGVHCTGIGTCPWPTSPGWSMIWIPVTGDIYNIKRFTNSQFFSVKLSAHHGTGKPIHICR